MATLDQVLDQMAMADMPPLPPGHPLLDGSIHRYGPKKKCWYQLHEFRARNQTVVIVGAFGRWSGTDNGKIAVKANFGGIDADEYKRIQATQVQAQVREREKRDARVRFAAHRAKKQWNEARARPGDDEEIAYLKKKGLRWENGLRLAKDGTLLVPMVRYDVDEKTDEDPDYSGPRRLAGLQKITPAGDKLFNRGMDPVGAACIFGRRKLRDGDLILLGEGLATVLSAFQGLERAYPAVVAFTAGNLAHVARILRALYPASPILFLADDDAYLTAQLNKRLLSDYGAAEIHTQYDIERRIQGKNGELVVRADIHVDGNGTPVLTAGVTSGEKLRTIVLKNAGRMESWEASREVGNAWVCWPEFEGRVLSHEPEAPRLTDFNDLQAAEGLPCLVEQLAAAIKQIEDAHELARGLAAGKPEPAAAAGGKGGGGGDEDEPDWALHGAMLRRFTQIYPSDEAYDIERGTLVKVAHMRLRFGSRAVALWLASPRKRIVDLKNVVFDPEKKVDDKTSVNLFRGLPLKAGDGDPTKCRKLLELLQFLCGEAEQDMAPVTEWVLKWTALPLQRPGAKMQTAVVMHGEEGAGKNLFWGVVRDLYGDHGGTITQMQLESNFNDWLSAQLFLIANEVVTQQHKRHHVGYLKNLITEPEIWINPKNIGARREANHANLVFLSNELQPLQIGMRDRRYMVIRTPDAQGREFYAAAAAEARAGGTAALFQYLLELDLGDFTEHSKPLLTEAKQALIEVGLSSPQLFWQELKDGTIDLPYGPALVTDVYKAFQIWCMRNGEKMPQRINLFTPAFMQMNGVRRIRDRVPNPDAGVRGLVRAAGDSTIQLKQHRIFVMGPQSDTPEAEKVRISKGIIEFRERMRDYVGAIERSRGGGDERPASRMDPRDEPAL
jgi:putative DNA primase/helicase